MKKKQQEPRYVQGELWPEPALENFMGGGDAVKDKKPRKRNAKVSDSK